MGVIAVGTAFYMGVEGWNFLDSLYFSVATLSTVGYGDLHPTRAVTKIFTIFYIITGVAIVLYAFSVIASHYFEEHHPNVRKRVFGRIGKVVNKEKNKNRD